MKEKITCELFSHADSIHLQQLYTGFGILHRRGILQLIQRINKEDIIDKTKPPHLRGAKARHLKVVVNGRLILYYDADDSFEIDDEILNKVDFYFKRSYASEELNNHNSKEKIFPLGLNYPVYSKGLDMFLIRRVALHKGIEKFKNLGKGIGIDYLLGGKVYVPRVNQLEFYPDFNLPPKVLFMVQAWDPNKFGSKDKSKEIESINNTRAQCTRLLKKEFGELFLGGFIHDDYSMNRFRDYLLPDNKLAKKKNYMKLLKDFPICVATTGLYGSTGWKLAEYICYSKAIITECLNYQIPGQFEKELNYLEFTSPEGCVESAKRLFQDYKLRCQLMINNYRYYRSYLRPDSLVLNTLAIAMSSAVGKLRPNEPDLW
jgi:hypothetical protein